MTERELREKFVCTDGLEHRIGQNYDERRGVGNGPQLCLRCKVSLDELVTQYGDTREREGREWHEINVSDESTYPPFDTPVLARMAYDNKKFEPIYIVVKHVDEDDCSWRTSDGDELSYWVNVTHWQVIAELKEEV